MLQNILPKKFNFFLELIRFNKPIGFMLLMWPCLFSLALIEKNQNQLINYYIYFIIGSFLMRSAGCIINDLIDINIDKKIERTSARPLTSNDISIKEAFFLLSFLLLLSLIILLQFKIQSILIGLASVPLIIIYPFMKRYTYWPQFFLGLIFSWGILIVSVEFYNKINFYFLLLYVGCIFWTLGYDTIYAYQDRKDDLLNNIKSTAVLFDSKGNFFVMFVYSIFFLIIGFLGYNSSSSFLSILVIIPFIFAMIIYLNKWNLNSKNSSNYYFKFNNFIGLFCFVFLMIF
tara:strand:- start:111 stop:974 length:864 start_codon:yes stop_codon:yes gene_type:complete